MLLQIHMKRPRRRWRNLSDVNGSMELKLDGHIYLVQKDEEGKIVSEDELDGETCLNLLVAVLDDSVKNPYLETVFSNIEK